MHTNVNRLLSEVSGRSEIVPNDMPAPPKSVARVAEGTLPTALGEFSILGYRSLVLDEEFVVLTRGSLRAEKPTLARIHSQCTTGDLFGSTKCDCRQQLKAAMKLIERENCGFIIYQQQKDAVLGS